MNYAYTKQQLLNMKKASASAKKSKPKTLGEFLRLMRVWTEEAKNGNYK